MLAFERDISNGKQRVETAFALLLGNLAEGTPLLCIHSQCFTSEVLGSLRCDCKEQLEIAMRTIAEEGRGLVIYEYQEGRGIDANHALGLTTDCRDFSLPAAILHELGTNRVRLLTNNPEKSRALYHAGIEVIAQVQCETTPTLYSLAYLGAKKEHTGHAHSLERHETNENVDPFASIEVAIRELKAGRMIVVVDDPDRENEGDLTIAAEMITPEAINFMASHGRGLICLAMTGERLDELELGLMVPENAALAETAFTVSIDVRKPSVTTGISAYDRACTVRAAIDATTRPADLARPGHVFPLRARPGGVLERRGQTEAAVDLARLAGLYPAGVICEVVNEDGTMARVPDLIRFCERHNLVMVSVADLARYRLDSDFDGGVCSQADSHISSVSKERTGRTYGSAGTLS
jgi:3,4-dihydroxy-2-butanone 4-phosphate synthase